MYVFCLKGCQFLPSPHDILTLHANFTCHRTKEAFSSHRLFSDQDDQDMAIVNYEMDEILLGLRKGYYQSPNYHIHTNQTHKTKLENHILCNKATSLCVGRDREKF